MGEEQGRPMTFFGNLMRIVADPKPQPARSAKNRRQSPLLLGRTAKKPEPASLESRSRLKLRKKRNLSGGYGWTTKQRQERYRLQFKLLQEFRVQLL